jgi:hypothetical protein
MCGAEKLTATVICALHGTANTQTCVLTYDANSRAENPCSYLRRSTARAPRTAQARAQHQEKYRHHTTMRTTLDSISVFWCAAGAFWFRAGNMLRLLLVLVVLNAAWAGKPYLLQRHGTAPAHVLPVSLSQLATVSFPFVLPVLAVPALVAPSPSALLFCQSISLASAAPCLKAALRWRWPCRAPVICYPAPPLWPLL